MFNVSCPSLSTSRETPRAFLPIPLNHLLLFITRHNVSGNYSNFLFSSLVLPAPPRCPHPPSQSLLDKPCQLFTPDFFFSHIRQLDQVLYSTPTAKVALP